eukprot:gene11370-14529_t
MIAEAEVAFSAAVKNNPNDSRSWLNLGETLSHLFKLDESANAFGMAVTLGERDALARLLKTKPSSCILDGPGGLEYSGTPGSIQRILHARSPVSFDSKFKVPKERVASLWTDMLSGGGHGDTRVSGKGPRISLQGAVAKKRRL